MAGLSSLERAKALLEQRRKMRITAEASESSTQASGATTPTRSPSEVKGRKGEAKGEAGGSAGSSQSGWETSESQGPATTAMKSISETKDKVVAKETKKIEISHPTPPASSASARKPLNLHADFQTVSGSPTPAASPIRAQEPRRVSPLSSTPQNASTLPRLPVSTPAFMPQPYPVRPQPPQQSSSPTFPIADRRLYTESQIQAYNQLFPRPFPPSGFPPSSIPPQVSPNRLPFVPPHPIPLQQPSSQPQQQTEEKPVWSPPPQSKPVKLARPSISELRSTNGTSNSNSGSLNAHAPTFEVNSSKPKAESSSSRLEIDPPANIENYIGHTSVSMGQVANGLVAAQPESFQGQAQPLVNGIYGTPAASTSVYSSEFPPARLFSLDFSSDDPRFVTVYNLLTSTLLENAKMSLQLEVKSKRIEELSVRKDEDSSSVNRSLTEVSNEEHALLEEALNAIVHLEDDISTCLHEISYLRSTHRPSPLVELSVQTDDVETPTPSHSHENWEEKYKALESLSALFKVKATAKLENLNQQISVLQTLLSAQKTELDASHSIRNKVTGLEKSLKESEKQLEIADEKKTKFAARVQELSEQVGGYQKDLYGLRTRAKKAEETVKAMKWNENELKSRITKFEILHRQEVSQAFLNRLLEEYYRDGLEKEKEQAKEKEKEKDEKQGEGSASSAKEEEE
ncbi:uncharacterized protein JCM6883_001352 [Sporobolomyces salmoneus]|uniref:uncharacterized protein n=1 Tax=Sporobolomyces salmoneus TaxID=183962 RepID=UPI00317CA531